MKKKVTVKEELFKKKNNIALRIKNLSFKYRPNYPYVLRNVSFDVKEGEYVAIIGHNGSGKSTLSKIIIGILNYNEGDVEIFGHKVTPHSIHKLRHFVGIVFQNPDNQFIGSTVEADVAFGLENACVPQKDMKAIIDWAVGKVGMEKFLHHEPSMLSGGQKQKVAIASAIAAKPSILIADEASSMLDPPGRDFIKSFMLEWTQKDKRTVVSITHDMDEEIINTDKIIVLNKGKLVTCGTPKEVFANPKLLRSIKLDIPFVYHIIESLNLKGFNLKKTFDIDDLVEQISDHHEG